jgi:flagellar biosynthesis/type III secretory pathway M-ring protein FliF/YscJ
MRLRTASFITGILVLLGIISVGISQEQGYLSQKLLLETTVQQRITDAVSKILDESQFVVDVKIELAISPTRQVETVYRTPDGRLVDRGTETPGREDMGTARGQTPGERARGSVTNPFPIPGFPDVAEDEAPIEAITDEDESFEEEDIFPGEEGVAAQAPADQTFAEIAEGLPQIKSMSINVILEDGVSPQTIENVRQVALIASRFDRDRGDILSITTASFKDRRPSGDYADAATPMTEIQIEQTSQLEEKLREAQARNEELMHELRQKELDYLQRSEE